MVLKLSDFACFIANWQNKADNLKAIARQLNLGLDSLVFVDDNPAERALVRRLCARSGGTRYAPRPRGVYPGMSVHRYFETTSLTRDDASRPQYYKDDAQRRESADQATDLNSFLQSLAMTMNVEPIHELNISA